MQQDAHSNEPKECKGDDTPDVSAVAHQYFLIFPMMDEKYSTLVRNQINMNPAINATIARPAFGPVSASAAIKPMPISSIAIVMTIE